MVVGSYKAKIEGHKIAIFPTNPWIVTIGLRMDGCDEGKLPARVWPTS